MRLAWPTRLEGHYSLRAVDPLRAFWISSPATAECFQQFQVQEQADAVDYLAGVSVLSECAGLKTHRAVLAGLAPSSLLQVVQLEHLDLIVIYRHGATGITRWALGSVTERVLQGSTLPLLLVHAHAAPG